VQDKLGQVKDKARELSRRSPIASTPVPKSFVSVIRVRRLPVPPRTGSSVGVAYATIAWHNVQDSVARGMQKSADWLRNGDLKADIEQQVARESGRTLLIALGVGYLLGKAFRRDR
jgi:hypothetical protein